MTSTYKYGKNGKDPFRVVTVFIPRAYVQYIDNDMCEYDFPNRSEVVRTAVRELIYKHILAKKKISPELEESEFTREMNARVIRIA
jgi:Arc/MetJ-type ribon-helix-helix transcriptional regulator